MLALNGLKAVKAAELNSNQNRMQMMIMGFETPSDFSHCFRKSWIKEKKRKVQASIKYLKLSPMLNFLYS